MYRLIVENISDALVLDWLIKETRKRAPNLVIRYEEVKNGEQANGARKETEV